MPHKIIACVADVRGRGEGEKRESGEKGKGPLPSLPNPAPFFLPFFQIILKKSELKTAHNTFRGCRVHFIRQPFSK